MKIDFITCFLLPVLISGCFMDANPVNSYRISNSNYRIIDNKSSILQYEYSYGTGLLSIESHYFVIDSSIISVINIKLKNADNDTLFITSDNFSLTSKYFVHKLNGFDLTRIAPGKSGKLQVVFMGTKLQDLENKNIKDLIYTDSLKLNIENILIDREINPIINLVSNQRPI